jgi:hypothetical protein
MMPFMNHLGMSSAGEGEKNLINRNKWKRRSGLFEREARLIKKLHVLKIEIKVRPKGMCNTFVVQKDTHHTFIFYFVRIIGLQTRQTKF